MGGDSGRSGRGGLTVVHHPGEEFWADLHSREKPWLPFKSRKLTSQRAFRGPSSPRKSLRLSNLSLSASRMCGSQTSEEEASCPRGLELTPWSSMDPSVCSKQAQGCVGQRNLPCDKQHRHCQAFFPKVKEGVRVCPLIQHEAHF